MKTTQETKQSKSDENRSESVYNDPKTGKFIKDNPGKPLGTKHEKSFVEFYDEIAEDIAKQNNMSVEDVKKVIYKVGYAKAKEGNYSFYKDILDRIHGQATQKHDVSGGLKLEVDTETKEKINKAIDEVL